MKKAFVLLIICLLALSAVAQFEHPDLKSGKKHIGKVVLMPVMADISRVSMKGPEPMIEESRQAERDLTPVIASSLREMQLQVDDSSLSTEKLKDDPELRYVVDDLQKQYDAATGQIMRKSKDVRKGRFTLGENVTRLPTGEGQDALIFVRAQAQVLTGGKKAFGWIVGGGAFDVMQIVVGVVDARNGDVLYFAKPVMLKNLAKDPAVARVAMTKSFKNFVKANALSESATAPSAVPAPAPPATTRAFAETKPPETSPAESRPAEPAVTTEAAAEAAPAAEAPETVSTAPVAEAAKPAEPVAEKVAEMPTAPTTPKVYVFVQRTEHHISRSDAEVFDSAWKDIGEYLKSKNVAVATEASGNIAHSELDVPTENLLKVARGVNADSVLYIQVDRPVSKWIEFKVQCMDSTGNELWKASAASGGGFSGGHGLRVGLEHLRSELDKHVGQIGMPLVVPNAQQTAVGK